ncbi:hemolysin III family protein [Candidatus Moduliflexota bacterium]
MTDVPSEAQSYPLGEEAANAITHSLGVALSITALVLLVISAARTGDSFRMVSGITFGSSLVFLYLASTLYHGLPSPRAKGIFKVFDHAGIYLLIAGSYTPFALVTLRGPVGWTLFGVVWVLAAAGIVSEVFWLERPRWLATLLFIGMGWIVIFAVKPLTAALPQGGLWLLLAGGLAYTAGTIFYLLKSIPYMHALWHLWVIAGSACHVLAVLLYVL